ncbi:unnamed protein product [Taenia asiatica]|uniref:HTH psq-type domain-containing protein n=1 Tax=Taenia asiatica TaxID=60517 RepID=A0A0R3VUI9_TAEAS|nr:unnamed protein product [Taenia asiatica]
MTGLSYSSPCRDAECLPSNNANGNSNSTTLSERDETEVAAQRRQQVRVIANYKGCQLIGEGFNLRTAKLKIAEQLGIGLS